MAQFNYRLTEKIYENRIENEDGPGSLENIMTRVSECRVINIWSDKSVYFGKHLMKSHSLDLPEDSADGRIEYSYTLERRACGDSGEWFFLGFLYPNNVEE